MTPKCPDCKRDQEDCVCPSRFNPVVIDQIVRQQEEIEDLRRQLAASYDRSAERKPRLCSECAHSYAIAREALRIGADESQDDDRAGVCAHSHVKTSNNEADLACCDSAPISNVESAQ